ncbi:oligoendopeptidase F [Acidaminobacter hydrogenoformans]|uniref:Oligopeptidase F n=1 Tax=Acidaminobacter hydrogenoformans DSM 2784 TaxID=1120920 RepID=A0A1G5S7R7_9FIRM|nr:oligoendopeptidase F [Acidaminobacter hydrogenoformans]SCZ81940.1 oligopeptidase F. Metallo peptidase. MEROPS family M03B [Acidaminobacter hydrogenoformans DSM 2784]
MGALLERHEIPVENRWTIREMYPSQEDWERDFEATKGLINALTAFMGKVGASADTLRGAVDAELALSRKLSNLYAFAKMQLDEDTRVGEHQALVSRMESLSVAAQEAGAFLVPEIMAIDTAIMSLYLGAGPLADYKQYLHNILRFKPHTLSEKEEALLAMAGEMASAPSTVFEMLNAADMKFPEVEDSKGNKIQLTHGNFIPTMESQDRGLRQAAFRGYYKSYQDHIYSMASLLQSEVKKNQFFSRARNFKSARAAALFENHVPVKVYDQLIEAIHRNLPKLHKYISVRKRMLGLEEMHMYDLYVPLIPSVTKKIDYETAKAQVLESLEPLGEAYVETVKAAFDQGWIDVYENAGKRSGAYSWGTYDSKPYILLNYQETLDSMFTLTHEMGHSMHSYMTHHVQPYLYGHYSIFLAEVASTTNEALLNDYLLKRVKDKAERLHLLNHYLDQFRTTVFRQAMFAEFEREIHEAVETGGALTADGLKILYRGLNEKYYGPDVVIDDEIAIEWARIPHFYYNFYVFQYATGFSAAIALSKAILGKEPGAAERYLEFLGAGRSAYPIEILKAAGADMASGAPVDEALELFGELVEEFDQLTQA